MKPLRITFVSDWTLPHFGGIECHIRDLALKLVDRGHFVSIVTTTPSPDPIQNVRIVSIRTSLLRWGQIAWNPTIFGRLLSVIDDEKPHLIHAHASVVSPLAHGSLWCAQKLRLPSVLTVHSLVKKSPHFFRLLKPFLGWQHWPVLWTGVSQPVIRNMQKILGNAATVTCLPNGIHLEDWKLQRPLRLSPDPCVLISVMRLTRKKRPADLILALKTLLSRTAHHLILKIIGEGSERPFLEKLIKRLKLQNHVQLLGYRSRDEIRTLFETADLFVSPTQKEAFGIAVLEARAAGLPVLAMASGGAADFIAHEENGLLAKNQKDLAVQVLRFLHESDLRKRLLENARSGVEKYDWSFIVTSHEQLYEQALKLPPKKAST